MLCAVKLYAFSAHSHIVPSSEIAVDQDSVAAADSAAVADSVAFSRLPWYSQLIENGFRIHDKNVNYPKFPRL